MDLQGWAGGNVSMVGWWISWAWDEQMKNCLTLWSRENPPSLISWQRKPHRMKSLFSHDCLTADCKRKVLGLLLYPVFLVSFRSQQKNLGMQRKSRVLNVKECFICCLFLACFSPPVFSTNHTYWWKLPKQEDSPTGKTKIFHFPPLLLSEVSFIEASISGCQGLAAAERLAGYCYQM